MSNNGGRSDIFESFVKIALKEGLISEGDHAEHTETSFPETNPRHDSLSIEQIGKLYNTKPSAPKEMEYKKNIMETAHPDSLVISPSHDKLNGLIENEIEGQNIRLHIVHKEPDGHLTQRKYAEKQLILSLVRVANDLDNRNQEELRKLADVCLIQASGKQFRKIAFPLMFTGIAAAVAALYAKQHLNFHSDGFEADYQKAIKEIDDLLNSNTNWQIGYSYTPTFIQTLNKLKTELAKIQNEVQKILPLLNEVDTPHTTDELKELGKQSTTMSAAQALSEFRSVIHTELPFINEVISEFSDPGYKQRAIAQKGGISSMVDATEILHGGYGLMADDFDDVVHALNTLLKDIKDIAQGLIRAQNHGQALQQKMQSAETQETEMFSPPTAPAASPTQTAPSPAPASGEVSSLEDAYNRFMGKAK
jgi:hypothetical protein